MLGQSITMDAWFASAGVAKTGLTVTWDVFAPDGTQLITGAAAVVVAEGFYRYTLSGTLVTQAGNYRFLAKTTDTSVDQQQLPGVWFVEDVTVAGRYTVAATVIGSDLNPVSDAQVSMRDSADAKVLKTAYTDTAGVATFQLDAAVYKAHISASSLYASIAVQTVTVAADLAVSYTLPLLAFAAAVAPGLCAVRLRLSLNGRPRNGYTFAAVLVDQNSTAVDDLLSLSVDQKVTGADGVAGEAILTLVQGGQFVTGTGHYLLTVTDPAGKVSSQVTKIIPNQSTAEYADLLP